MINNFEIHIFSCMPVEWNKCLMIHSCINTYKWTVNLYCARYNFCKNDQCVLLTLMYEKEYFASELVSSACCSKKSFFQICSTLIC